jgi:hypothetical protein
VTSNQKKKRQILVVNNLLEHILETRESDAKRNVKYIANIFPINSQYPFDDNLLLPLNETFLYPLYICNVIGSTISMSSIESAFMI